MSPHRARSMRGPRSRIFAGSLSCQRCAGSTTWSSTLMIFGMSLTASLRLGEGIVLVSGVEAAVLAHEGRGAAVDAPAVTRPPVFVAVPAEPHGVCLLIDEHEVL